MNEVLMGLATALAGFGLGLVGDYWLQQRLSRRYKAADELKKRLYEFLGLVADYWISGAESGSSLQGLEARLKATQFIITAEYTLIIKHSKKLKTWYLDTEKERLDLLEAATGIPFPFPSMDTWIPDPGRVNRARRCDYSHRQQTLR